MKTIYRVEHDGVVGVIESPDEIDSTQPLSKQLIVKIGFSQDAPPLDTADFEPRSRLVVLELLNYLQNELGIERTDIDI
jgi:hypothetical protein